MNDLGISLGDSPRPQQFVDVIVEMSPGKILLIERAGAPFGYALPGGYVDAHEEVSAAAIREVLEETGITISDLNFWGRYKFVASSGICRGITNVFTACGVGEILAADDALSACAVPLRELLDSGVYPLIPEHRRILLEYEEYQRTMQPVMRHRVIESSLSGG